MSGVFRRLWFAGLVASACVSLPAAEPVAVEGTTAELARLTTKLADTEARLRSLTEDNHRLNTEVKAAAIALGNLRREMDALRVQAAGAVSGRTEAVDRERIAGLESTLAAVRTSSDRADAQARGQIDDAQRLIGDLRKRLDEAGAEPARLRAQLATTEQALAAVRTQAAAEKKRAESR